MRYIIILFLGMIGCNPEPNIKPNPCILPDCIDTIKFPMELVWQRPLRIDTQYTVASNQPILLKDKIVFYYDATEAEKLLFVDNKDASTSRFFGQNIGNYHGGFYDAVAGLITADYKSIFCGTNANNMKKIASAPNGLQFGSNNALIGPYLYMSDVYDEALFQTYVLRINIFTGEILKYKTLKDPQHKGYNYCSITAPVYFDLGNQDTLFSYVNYINIDDEPIITTETYSQNENKLLWIDSIFRMPGSQDNALNYNNKMISVPGSNIYCINPINGDIY